MSSVMTRKWFRDHDQEWYREQNKDQQWIKKQEDIMAQYTKVFEGFLNDNSENVQKNAKSPKYRSSGSGKSAIVAQVDIPKGSVITFAAWGGRGPHGAYVKITGQLVHQDAPQYQTPQQENQPAAELQPPKDFDDDMPF